MDAVFPSKDASDPSISVLDKKSSCGLQWLEDFSLGWPSQIFQGEPKRRGRFRHAGLIVSGIGPLRLPVAYRNAKRCGEEGTERNHFIAQVHGPMPAMPCRCSGLIIPQRQLYRVCRRQEERFVRTSAEMRLYRINDESDFRSVSAKRSIVSNLGAYEFINPQ